MKPQEQTPFSSVLSVDPYKEVYYKGVSDYINNTDDVQYQKDQYAISYLNTKDYITSKLEISKNIPEEDLYDALSNKAYDELALDQAVEYKIQFIETFNSLDEENRHFHVFIVDPNDISNIFENVIKSIKYIDTILPVALLIKSLYSKEIVDSSGAHCYIYLQENDAFLTVYSEGDFLYTKSIKYSFFDMHERFCELYGERIDYEEFINYFTQENFKTSQSEYKTYFIKLFKELFTNINDILTYVKRAFEIEKIHQVYIGSQVQTTIQLDEMLEVELEIKADEFNFDYGLDNSNEYVDQIHALMYTYANLGSEKKYICNFTQYERPPKFIQRDSGRLIAVAAASLILAFIYPVTYWGLNYAQQLQKDLLQQKYNEVHNLKVTREVTIKNKEADKDKVSQLFTNQNNDYKEKKQTLTKIHEVKVGYPMKSQLLVSLSKDLSKFHLHVTSAGYTHDNNKTLKLQLASKNDRYITKLIEYLTKRYENKYTYGLKKIGFDDETQMYLSELKVSLR